MNFKKILKKISTKNEENYQETGTRTDRLESWLAARELNISLQEFDKLSMNELDKLIKSNKK